MSILLSLLLSVSAVSGADPTSSTESSPETSQPDRSHVDEQARRQATRVMNAGLPFVEQALATNREFPPFGAVMLPTGKIQTLGTAPGAADVDLEEIYEKLIDGLREGAVNGGYQAVATFALVELRRPEDGEIINAVHVALEHQDGYCVNVYYPTVLEGSNLVLGEAIAGRRAGTFFEACARSPQG